MNYRPRDREDAFRPSPFSLIVIDEQGEIIGTSRAENMSNFNHSLLIKRPIIESGKYTLVVDVCWDECVKLDPGYDDVLVRIFTKEKLDLQMMDAEHGKANLVNALKKVASSSQNTKYRKYYRSDDDEYGGKVYRVSDPDTNVGFYGFCYRKNASAYASNEKLIINLTGLQFVTENSEDFIKIPSGGDHIIVMRNDEAFGSTSYSMSMALKNRSPSDAENVSKTRASEKKQITDNVTYQTMLSDEGGCLVIENSSDQDQAK